MAITVVTVEANDKETFDTDLTTALASHAALNTFEVKIIHQDGYFLAVIFTVTP